MKHGTCAVFHRWEGGVRGTSAIFLTHWALSVFLLPLKLTGPSREAGKEYRLTRERGSWRGSKWEQGAWMGRGPAARGQLGI